MRKPTFKQKQFVKKYIKNNGNATKAVLEVYEGKPQNAPQVAHDLMSKPIVQRELKHQLEMAGITLDVANDYLFKAMHNNLDRGKPSQAVGADLLKFVYKLYDVIPSNKNLNLNYTKKEIVNKSYDELKEELTKVSNIANKLLTDL